jgi:hypothetical protein
MTELRFELVDERDLGDKVRRQIGQLLVERFGDVAHDAAERGWILHPPEYRVLAWDGDLLAGTLSSARLESDPPIVAYGIGDTAVRGRVGMTVILTLIRLAIEEGTRRRAQAIFSWNSDRWVSVGRRLGVARVTPGELYLRQGDNAPFPLFGEWWVLWLGEKVVPLTIAARF